MMDLREYAQLDGIDLATLIRNGEVSRREITETAIHAIEAVNESLNAVVIKNFERALENSDNPVTGRGDNPLDGVPILIKDCNVFTYDMPTTYSSRYFDDALPKPDSTIIARWRSNGLNLMGKTNLPEFAAEFVCESTWRGICANPWNPKITTGGSSGGAASAVASAMVPIAHATDLGGSIRIPAACCGLYGLKPTVGLNPTGPYAEIANGLNSDHVVTRSVRDSAASLDITCGADTSTRYHVMPGVSSYLSALEQRPEQLTIGYCLNAPDGSPIQSRHALAVETTVKLLTESGHRCVPFSFPSTFEIGAWYEALWVVDAIAELNAHEKLKGRPPHASELEALTRLVVAEVSAMSAAELQTCKHNATTQANALLQAQNDLDLDLLVTPALAIDPPGVGTLNARVGETVDMQRWAELGYGFAPFSAPFNLTGQPAAVCPLTWDAGEAPLCVQVVGRHRQDHIVLQVSQLIEDHFPAPGHTPPVSVAGAR